MKNDHIFIIYNVNTYASPEDIEFALEFQSVLREHLPEGLTAKEIGRVVQGVYEAARGVIEDE